MQNQASLKKPVFNAISRLDKRTLADFFDQKRSTEGKDLWFITTTYLEPANKPLSIPLADSALKKTHKALLVYLSGTTNYRRPWFRAIEPDFFAFRDEAGSKRKNYSSLPLHASTHHHHIVAIADECHSARFKRLTDPRKARAFALENRQFAFLRTINVQPIGPTIEDVATVTDYATSMLRQIEQRSVGSRIRYDAGNYDFVILPEQPRQKVEQPSIQTGEQQ